MPSNREMKFTAKLIGVLLCIMFIIPSSLYAGRNITSKSGVLSKLSEKDGATTYVYLDIFPPESGKKYVVKCNFLKVETSAKAWDAYADWVCKNPEKDCSVIMDRMRSLAKEAKSRAELVLTTSGGSEVGRIPKLGATTFGEKIKFTANSASYKVKIECKEGAGLYHFVFEYK